MSVIQRSRGLVSEELSENFLGSDGSGADGEENRIYTIVTISTINITKVYYEGMLLREDIHYTKNDTTRQVTILINVWDDNTVTLFYNII